MQIDNKDKVLQKISLFLDGMTPNDRLELFMDKDGTLKYESRVVDKGIV